MRRHRSSSLVLVNRPQSTIRFRRPCELNHHSGGENVEGPILWAVPPFSRVEPSQRSSGPVSKANVDGAGQMAPMGRRHQLHRDRHQTLRCLPAMAETTAARRGGAAAQYDESMRRGRNPRAIRSWLRLESGLPASEPAQQGRELHPGEHALNHSGGVAKVGGHSAAIHHAEAGPEVPARR